MLTSDQISAARTQLGPPPTANGPAPSSANNGWDSFDAQMKPPAASGAAPGATATPAAGATSTAQPTGVLGGIGSALDQRASDFGKDATAPPSVGDLAGQRPIRLMGDVAGGIGDIVGGLVKPILASPSNPANAIGGQVNQNLNSGTTAQAAKSGVSDLSDKYQDWAAKNPDASKNLESILNVASVLPVGEGAKMAEEGAVGAAKDTATSTAESTAKDAAAKQAAQDEALSKATDTYRQVLNLGKKQSRVELKAALGGKPVDLAEEMAREQLPIETGPDKKIDVTKAAQVVQDRAGQVNDKLDAAIGKDPTQWHSVDQAVEDTKQKVLEGSGTATYKKQVLANLDSHLADEKELAGVDPEQELKQTGLEAQKAKRSLYAEANYDKTAPQASNDAKKALASTLRENLETHYKDSADISGLNQQLRKYEMVDDALKTVHGQVVRGGVLGKRLNQLAGVALGTAGAGPIGGLVGGEVAGRLTDYALDPARRTAAAAAGVESAGVQNGAQSAAGLSDLAPKGEAPVMGQAKITDPSQFARSSGLSPENKTIEDAAFNKVSQKEDQILADYKNKPGTQGGKIVNADSFRPYFKDVGYAGHNAAAVQEPASYLGKRAFTEALKNPGEDAVLYAGGSGTGKTSAIKDIPELKNTADKAAVVLDGNLSSLSSAESKIKEATAAGKKTPIMYVYRDPVESFREGVVKRSLNNPDEMGRLVPTKVVAGNHVDSWDVVNKLADSGQKVQAVDNSLGRGKAALTTLDSLKQKVSYPSKSELTQILNGEAKKMLDAGTITPEQYKGYTE